MSNNWSFVNFGEVFAEPVRNGVYKAAEFQGSGMHIVNMKELFGYEFIGNQKMRKIELSNDEKERFLLKNGDLLFARRSIVEEGSGKISLIKGLTGELTFESSIIRVRLNLEKAYPLFYYYYFSSPVGKPSITALSSGVTVKGIRGSDLRNVKIRYPPLTIQQKIAAILSAYDDLIENNLKRIKLLEEMAQITYEEWFVRMKFPGHETTPMDSETELPVGWSREKLGNLASYINRGISPDYVESDGSYVINQKCIREHFVNFDEARFTSKERKIPDEKLIKKFDILINSTGTGTLGRVAQVFESPSPSTVDTHVTIVRASFTISALYLGRALEHIDSFIANLGKGATNQQEISRTDLAEIVKIVVPTKDLLIKYDEFSSPLYESISIYRSQNQLLKEARDILLPRLMTGMIDVEQLDLPESLGELSLNLTQEPQAA